MTLAVWWNSGWLHSGVNRCKKQNQTFSMFHFKTYYTVLLFNASDSAHKIRNVSSTALMQRLISQYVFHSYSVNSTANVGAVWVRVR